jgi:hypothetical protein
MTRIRELCWNLAYGVALGSGFALASAFIAWVLA